MVGQAMFEYSIPQVQSLGGSPVGRMMVNP